VSEQAERERERKRERERERRREGGRFKRERAEIFLAHATVYHFGSAAYINPVI